jgi:serpin B
LLAAGLAAAAATQLAACAGRKPDVPGLLTADVPRSTPGTSAPVPAAIAGMTSLANHMIRSNATTTNYVISPLSLACAFAMARVGAGGTTAAQLDRVFGFPATGRDEAFNAITRDLATTAVPPTSDGWKHGQPPPEPVVAIGDALFTSQGLPLGAAFLRTLASQYGTGARPVDFASGQAAQPINAWVRAQTAGRITKLFDMLDPSTLLVLANAVYFKAHWATTFDAGTVDAPFIRPNGSTVTAQMMSQVMSAGYGGIGGAKVVELPYAGGPYAMWVILPKPGGVPADVLDARTLAAIPTTMRQTRLAVSIPKFDFETDLDLVNLLMKLGLTAPFGPGADFSGISPGLFIDQAIHRANITVTEEGTVAAAVTGIGMVTSGVVRPPLSFVADRPFAFVILGGPHRVPLFVGQVTDPTA